MTTRDSRVREVTSFAESTAPDSDEEENDELEKVFSVEKQLMSLAVAKAALERHASVTSVV